MYPYLCTHNTLAHIYTYNYTCIHLNTCTHVYPHICVHMHENIWACKYGYTTMKYICILHPSTYLPMSMQDCLFSISEARFWVSHTCIDCSAHCCVYYHNCFHVVCGEPCRQEEGKNWGNCGGEKEWGEGDVKFLFSGLYTTTLCDQNSWKVLFEVPRGRIP